MLLALNIFNILWTTVVAIAVIAVALKLYTRLTIGWDKSYTCLVGKTALVTGANTGIGYETAKEFAKRGGRVILACRDRARAEEARRKIVEETDNNNVAVKIVDLSSLDSVRALAKDIGANEERLDILVNNAGLGGVKHKLTKDGLDLVMEVNYFSGFLLTLLLLDLLKKSTPSRIVNVSSITAEWGKVDPNDLNKKAGRFAMYARSKLCQILFTKALAKKLRRTGVTAYSLHPGVVATDMFRRVKGKGALVISLGRSLVLKSPLEGAQTQIYLSLAKDIEQFSGEYFRECKKVPPYKLSEDEGLVEKVWTKSRQLVGLASEEEMP